MNLTTTSLSEGLENSKTLPCLAPPNAPTTFAMIVDRQGKAPKVNAICYISDAVSKLGLRQLSTKCDPILVAEDNDSAVVVRVAASSDGSITTT